VASVWYVGVDFVSGAQTVTLLVLFAGCLLCALLRIQLEPFGRGGLPVGLGARLPGQGFLLGGVSLMPLYVPLVVHGALPDVIGFRSLTVVLLLPAHFDRDENQGEHDHDPDHDPDNSGSVHDASN